MVRFLGETGVNQPDRWPVKVRPVPRFQRISTRHFQKMKAAIDRRMRYVPDLRALMVQAVCRCRAGVAK